MLVLCQLIERYNHHCYHLSNVAYMERQWLSFKLLVSDVADEVGSG